MASVQTGLRDRAWELILGTAGVAGHAIAAGRFHRASEDGEQHSAERAVSVEMRARRPQTGYNNPLCGQGLYITPLVVRVTYVVGRGETTWEAQGEQSGGSDTEQVEDRAADDAQVLLAVLGYQSNWATVTPVVIDPGAVVPDAPPEPVVEIDGERATLTLTTQILTRADQHTAYGPTIT